MTRVGSANEARFLDGPMVSIRRRIGYASMFGQRQTFYSLARPREFLLGPLKRLGRPPFRNEGEFR
jgi:hypothetical protein